MFPADHYMYASIWVMGFCYAWLVYSLWSLGINNTNPAGFVFSLYVVKCLEHMNKTDKRSEQECVLGLVSLLDSSLNSTSFYMSKVYKNLTLVVPALPVWNRTCVGCFCTCLLAYTNIQQTMFLKYVTRFMPIY